jgi:outer membrane lipoprotein-sorting protein
MRRAELFASLVLAAGRLDGDPGLAYILERMAALDAERAAALKQYTSTRHYRLENKRFHTVAELIARMEYRAPGTKRFEVISEKGPWPVRQKVLRRMLDAELEASDDAKRVDTRITPRNYNFALLGEGEERGRRCYVLEIAPKRPNKFLVNGKIWVDAQDFAITRLEGRPAKNPSALIRSTNFVHTYEKRKGFWLAASNVSQSDSFLFGQTTVVIRYFDYQFGAWE